MNFKEYKIQKALGTVDYLVAARTTKSPKVLKDITNTINKNSSVTVFLDNLDIALAIVSNPNIYLDSLQKILFNSKIRYHSTSIIIEASVYNPVVTRTVLEEWIKSPFLNVDIIVRKRLYTLQAIDGIPERDRIDIDNSSNTTTYPYYSWPAPQPVAEQKEWTSTGSDIQWYPIVPASSILKYITTTS